jgi:hypothetical protein
MEPRDVVVVGGSAGSLLPLREMVRELPADLPGSVLVTMHVGSQARSRLPWLLSRSGPLPAAHAETGEAKLWAAVAALEETAVLARHLAGHPAMADDVADQHRATADRAAKLAELMQNQMQEPPGGPDRP